MRRIIDSEWTIPVLLALVLLGVAALLLGVSRFITTTQSLNANLAYQMETGGQTLDPASITPETAMPLVSAGLQMRDLKRERSEAASFIGAGVALIALGWLGVDLVRGRRRKLAQPTTA